MFILLFTTNIERASRDGRRSGDEWECRVSRGSRDLWVARDIILPYSLTYMRLMIEAVAFKAGRR